MSDIELRWLNRKTGKTLQNEHGFYYDETVKILQFRQYYDKTIYAGMGPHGDFLKQMIWSDWIDVKEVNE
jgi:hypothetical protein